MKRKTATNNLKKVIQRVNEISGIFETPMCSYEYLKVKRMWVFGSFAKGSSNPNDLDILIELVEPDNAELKSRGVERKSRRNKFRWSKVDSSVWLHGGFIGYRTSDAFGLPHVVCSHNELAKYLKAGTRGTSIHFTSKEEGLLAKLDVKILVYPRNDFDSIS